MSKERSAFLEKWYGNEEWRWGYYPTRVPRGGIKKYFWNWKCLEAPKPYFDNEGYYYWRDYFIRKIIPGLMPVPKPIKTMGEYHNLVDSLKTLLENRSWTIT